jgi:leucine dehydrogenase
MIVFEQPSYDGHEEVHFFRDEPSGLRAIVAIHSTALGPAAGGCRRWTYESEDAALIDALRLSRGMSYKNAVAGLPFGGGKAVIMRDPAQAPSDDWLDAFGEAVNRLGGRYITAEDVGVAVRDMERVARKTSFVAGLGSETKVAMAGGDPSPKTARGVFHGIQAAVRFALGRGDLEGLSVAVQGLGNVGRHLCRELHAAGARLVVADLDSSAVERVADEFKAKPASADRILFEAVDVLAPCALGGVLNNITIPKLRARVVAGGANNQLLDDVDGELLRRRGILYAPDYVINAGGIINVAAEYLGTMTEAQVQQKLAGIHDTLMTIFDKAARSQQSTSVVADQMARARLAKAAPMRAAA